MSLTRPGNFHFFCLTIFQTLFLRKSGHLVIFVTNLHTYEESTIPFHHLYRPAVCSLW